MPLVFACSASHTPGITAWPDAAPKKQKDAIYGAFNKLKGALKDSGAEVLVVIAPEHFANFFLSNMPAFCIGRGTKHKGPVEPWLNIERREIAGDSAFANTLLQGCYDEGFEISFSNELDFDHGVVLPIDFLIPDGRIPVVPIIFNALCDPMPSPKRCFELGSIIRQIVDKDEKKVAIIGTGGLSHWPGEAEHGIINERFDRQFLRDIIQNDVDILSNYSHEKISASGTGGHEVRSWITVAAAAATWKPELLTYQAVNAWATGCGFVTYHSANHFN